MRNPPAITLTNKQFATRDETFRVACGMAGVPVTTRQASKYRNGRGLAWKFHTAALIKLQRERAAGLGASA
jgi:hypothetical protein